MSWNIGSDLALAFTLLFARTSGMMTALPSMLGVPVPIRVRLLLSALIAASLMPLAHMARPVADGLLPMAILLARELALGAILSFASAIVIGGVLVASDVIGSTMELHLGAVLRPTLQMPSALGDAFAALTAVLFFVCGLHRSILLALGRSLSLAPLGDPTLPGLRDLLEASGLTFTIALQIALPILIPLLVLALAQGVVARLAPQINILFAAPAAVVTGGLFLLLLDSQGIAWGITHAWTQVLMRTLGWLNG